MNFSSYIRLELLRNISTVYLYLAIIASFIFGGGIVYSIYSLDGPFHAHNVSGLYSTIAVLALAIFCVKIVSIDLYYGTIQLIFTNKQNRHLFLYTRLIIITVISILFGIGCISLLWINDILNHQGFNLQIVCNTLFHYFLFGIFYTLLFLLISIFYKKPMNLLIIAFFTIVLIPSILGAILNIPGLSSILKEAIMALPIYSLPTKIASLSLSITDIFVIIGLSICLFVWIFYTLPKTDY
ncbi:MULTISPECIES: hypothetical protein [Bacillus cereus group]|uniref:Uncharacterized protein n=1 Tax=Bacillus thuringiensis TaxID=1428 RepID=A0A9X7GB12_BACTU|nr:MULTISPECIES: hypothetical protein [Bacillus cereus group]MED4441514.1 hypothetical protein [Bacillus cereus]MED3447809.1 hypothetical protein [Bacillus thuringiensis]PEB47741.1 hypothetical protein COM82_11320 [Bacillus thuringiensis]PED23540.1 hypothetical protein CON34_25710 [Bacillus thuringiensis]PFB51381.1 hypothetical protein CN396_00380 [Bacillus thuringiensis]